MEQQLENQVEKPTEMWSLIVGVVTVAIGLGCYFGVALYYNMDYVLAGGHIRGIDLWIRFVGNWLMVVGAFAVVLALLWRIVKKQW
jgi:hypothetical protein